MIEDTPRTLAWYTFNELMLGDQPSGWNILGPKEVIRSLKREDFVAYREKHYRAANTIVVIAGEIDIERTHDLVERYFSSISQGLAPEPASVCLEQKKPRLKSGSKKFDQSHLILGTWAFDYHDEKKYALSILETILGGTMSSRLFIKIRDKLGLAYYIRANTNLYNDYGFFEVHAGINADRLDNAIEAIVQELYRMAEEEVSEQEIVKAIGNIKGSTLIDLELSDAVASHFAEVELLWGEILTPEEEFSKLEKVTAADIRQVAQEIFTDERLNLAVVGPVKDEEKVRKHLTFSS